LLIPKDPKDDFSEIKFEIKQAVGGSESSLFAETALKMYLAYMDLKG